MPIRVSGRQSIQKRANGRQSVQKRANGRQIVCLRGSGRHSICMRASGNGNVRAWLGRHFLKCNANKTDVILIGWRHQTAKVQLSHVTTGGETVAPFTCVTNLGLIIDSGMMVASHIASICRSARYHLWNMGKIWKHLTIDACEHLVHALVTCILDINNALLYGLPQHLLNDLQHCQNVAAWIVTRQRQVFHISPVLMNLHWLPVKFRIEFKILL